MAGSTDRFQKLIELYVGDSEKHNARHLGELLARGIDDPDTMVRVRTNCGTFVLGVWWAVGVQHPLLMKPYQNGMAIAWVLQIARDLKALRRYPHDMSPVPGAVCHYKTKYLNNDHVEFLLGYLSPGVTDHAGGGRSNNAIGRAKGPITWNYGRPLIEWVDPVALLADATEPRDEALLMQLYLDSLEPPKSEPPTNPEANPNPIDKPESDSVLAQWDNESSQVGRNG